MQYALNANGERIQATRGVLAQCPLCRRPVVAKCGRIKVHHWAHHIVQECDEWFEPETPWHREWKSFFNDDEVEVTMGKHRADIRSMNGLVVELQSSSISPDMIREREKYYGNMIWILNAYKFADRFFILKAMSASALSFKWKHCSSRWKFAQKPVYLDFGSVKVVDLLGSKSDIEGDSFFQDGEEVSYARSIISRIESGNISKEPSLSDLPAQVMDSRILRLRTIHPKGYGSVQPVSDHDFLKMIGAVSLYAR